MFEDQTYEVILERMLSRMPDDIDKREGSIAFDSVAPASLEVAQVYHLMSIMYRLIFGETTDGDMLELRAANFGVYRKQATAATRKGVFTNSSGSPMDIVIGSIFTVDEINYVTTEKISLGSYVMTSESPGIIGNQPFGAMLPVESIDSLGAAELTDVLVAGVDAQSDEELAVALTEKQSKPAASGNEYDYERWAKEVVGVSEAKVYDNWNGPNTVKVVIMDTNKRGPSATLLTQVNEHIQSVRPVGAIVTIVSVTTHTLPISAKITLQEGVSIETAKQSISENVTNYFKSIAGKETIVRYTAVGNAILDSVGVVDYTDFKLQNSTANVTLNVDHVPLLGTLTIT